MSISQGPGWLSFFFLGLHCPAKNSPALPRAYGREAQGELISGCWSAFLDNLRKLSVWLGIHGGLSVWQAGHPRFAPRAAAPTAGAHIAWLLQLDRRFSAELLPAVRQRS